MLLRQSIRVSAVLCLFSGFVVGQQVPNALEKQVFPSVLSLSPASAPLSSAPAMIAAPAPVPPPAASQQRMLGVIPAFDVTDAKDAPPLTSKQKFTLAAREAFDPYEWATVGLENLPSEEGHGIAHFGHEYGLAMATDASGMFIRGYVYPTLFKQDPRYFRVNEGTARSRVLRSMEQEFWTRSDSGVHQFNYSGILGALTTASIPNAYIEAEDRGLGSTLTRCATSLVWDMASQLGNEFWPDIDRRLFHKHQKASIP